MSVLMCTNDWLVWCQQHLVTCLRTIGIHGVYKQLQWQARPVLKALLPHVNLHTVPHDKAMGWNESKHSVAMRANMQIWLNILLWGIATIAEFLTHDCHCSPSEHLGGPFVS